MLKTYYFLAMLVFLSSWRSVAQDKGISITGTIVDKATNTPIPFANIQLRGSGIGTASNAEGKFLLRLDSVSRNAFLVISSMGYQSSTLNLSEVNLKNETIVRLAEASIELKEIVVTPFTAQAIMMKVIDNLKTNYNAPPHRLDAFYRTTFQNDGNFTRLLEAAVFITDKKGALFGPRTIEIREIRKAKDIRTDPWKTYDGYLNDLVRNHPLQGRWWDFLNQKKLDQFDISIEETRLQDLDAYTVLSLVPKDSSPQRAYTARLIVKESNSAVVDITILWRPELSSNFSWAWEARKDEKFVADWQQSHYAYQEFNGFYYLKSAEWQRIGKVVKLSDNSTVYKTESFDELLVTKILSGKFPTASTSSNPDVYEVADNLPYHPAFWAGYNRPVDSQRFIKAKKEMEKTEKLATQFEKNTGKKAAKRKQ
jgi:CarboxypepD_reg-like domain